MDRRSLDKDILNLALEHGRQQFLPTSGPSREILSRFGIHSSGLSRHRPPFEICRLNHRFHCVFFCISGEATFITEKGDIKVRGGDLAVVPIGPHRYWTDSSWRYVWINFRDEEPWHRWNGQPPQRKPAVHLDFFAAIVEKMLEHTERWENDEIVGQWAVLFVTYLRRELLEPKDKLKDRLSTVWREVKIAPSYPWNVEKLAQMANLSVTHFKRMTRQFYSATPGDILTQIRLEIALDIMRGTDLKLENIADRVGYSSGFALSKAFRRFYGASPRKIASAQPHS